MLTVHFRSQQYQTPYLYYWQTQADGTQACHWPGVPMQLDQDGWWHLSIPNLQTAHVIISDAGRRQGPACYVDRELWLEEGQWPALRHDLTEAPGPGRPFSGQGLSSGG